MSKITDLRNKYTEQQISNTIFNKLVNSDATPTKKYCEYMINLWINKGLNKTITSPKIIEAVIRFNSLLPYIDNKDIYSYKNFDVLLSTIETAQETKDSKTFIKEEHTVTLIENENFWLMIPTTYEGSCKYGTSTKWCTAMKTTKVHFENYSKNGLLVYLIRKKTSGKNLKYAFHVEYNQKKLVNPSIKIYDEKDDIITYEQMANQNWNNQDIIDIFYKIVSEFNQRKQIRDAKSYISKFLESLNNMNFEEIEKNLGIIQNEDEKFVTDAKESIKNKLKLTI